MCQPRASPLWPAEGDGKAEKHLALLRNLLAGWLEVAMAHIERSRWEQGWKHLLEAEEDLLDVVFEAQAEFGSSPWLAVQQLLSSLPRR